MTKIKSTDSAFKTNTKMMKGEEITANMDACSSIMCKDSVILGYHMETPNMALANKQNGNSGLARRFCTIWFTEPEHMFNFHGLIILI